MAISITKPTVGGSEDSWGTTINTALDDIVLEINSNADGTNAITPNLGTGWQVGGTEVTSTAAELNILDGVTATAAEINILENATITTDELNILDGDTAAISTEIVDADRIVLNDDGTMKQVAVTDLATYINASAGTGSVTSVDMSVPTGLSISGNPITTSGTLAVTFASGYSIPTDTKQTSWDTAYGWGDHSSEGYLTSVPDTLGGLGTYAFLGRSSTGSISAGDSIAGSDLKYAGILSQNAFNDNTAGDINGASPSGTWRAMGEADFVSTRIPSTLFVKIAN